MPAHAPFVLLLAALALPLWMPGYWMTQATMICIYGLATLGMVVIGGWSGQIGLGQAAFLGLGAYVEAWLQAHGVPLPLSLPLSAAAGSALGVLMAAPAVRLSGHYLAIATLAAGIVAQEAFEHWSAFTGGMRGRAVDAPGIGEFRLVQDWQQYLLAAGVFAFAVWMLRNLRHGQAGRAWMALRDAPVAAATFGLDAVRQRTLAFVVSGTLTATAGALYAHQLRFLSPDQFGVETSLQILAAAVVGGLDTLAGALWGAVFFVALPQLVSLVRDGAGLDAGTLPGLESGLFGLALVLVVLFEPRGLEGVRRRLARAWLQRAARREPSR